MPQSLYSTQNKTLNPGQYSVPKKTGGGYWISEVDDSGADRKTFVANTTYRQEVCETHKRPGEVALASPRGMKASIFPTQTSLKAMKTARHEQWPAAGGAAVGYTSEYDRMVVKDPLTGGIAAAGSPDRGNNSGAATARAQGGQPRSMQMRATRVTEPKFDGVSVYAQNFGEYGSDPLSKSATNETGITQMASSSEFNVGTTKATRHIPGYSGFINKTAFNSTAVAAASGALSRPSEKDSMLLSALDQYSRDSIPQYGGFRPQVPLNIQPSQGFVKTTTSGFQNYQATKNPLKPVDNANFNNMNKGVMSFFTAGTLSVSDNGNSNAERYYAHVRPLEGGPRIHYPSQTTVSGYKFSN